MRCVVQYQVSYTGHKSPFRLGRTQQATVSHRAGLGCVVKEMTRKALRGQTKDCQRRVGRLSPGPSEVHLARLFAAPDTAVVGVGLNFLSVERPNC